MLLYLNVSYLVRILLYPFTHTFTHTNLYEYIHAQACMCAYVRACAGLYMNAGLYVQPDSPFCVF